jgi:predicted GIY-YIG superfamily endonuclease
MDYFAYILSNTAGRSYIGISRDPIARLSQHNVGESKWTAKCRPWTLVWRSRAMSLGDARRLENVLKRQMGGAGLGTLMREYGS